MTVVCRPYRLEAAERDLIFRAKHARGPSFARFTLGIAAAALAVAVILHLAVGNLLADLAPDYAAPQTTIPILAWIGTVAAGVFFARRMDAASAVFTPMPEQTVTVSPAGLHIETPMSVSDWHWTAWIRFHDLPEALLLEEPSGAMVVLPARAFPDPAARDAVRAMVSEKVAKAEVAKAKG